MKALNFNRDFLKDTLRKRDITYAKFIEMLAKNGLEVSEPTVKSWFNKVKATPDIDKIVKIASVLELDINDLVEQDIFDTRLGVVAIPVVGEASCGVPTINCYQDDEVIYINESEFKKELYAVIASGDSMTPKIDDGDRVVCDPTAEIINGDLVHYTLYDSDSAIKVYVRDDERGFMQFKPINSTADFKTITVLLDDKEMMDNLKMAKVIRTIRDVSNDRKENLKLVKVEI